MARVKKTVTVNAPVGEVFDYINDPTNLPEVWPNLLEVKDVKSLPNGGNSSRFVYEMAGVRIKGSGVDVECIANQRIVNKTQGGVESTMTWLFRPVAGGTEVTLDAEYTVPIPLAGRLAAAIIARINEKDIVYLMNSIKLRFARLRA